MKGWITSGLALAIVCAAAFAAAAEEAETAKGRKLALDVCAPCHVVAPGQLRPPLLNPPAPSFVDIAATPAVTADSLGRFLAEPHGASRRDSAMPAFLLPPSEVHAAVAYLISLKSR
jgi:mono/diheme cytochrome c family protein